MPELPRKKIGIVSCSGEELSEGTVSRLASLKVLEQLRPDDTVRICLPLFLAGGEADRNFAKFYPTITIDGCEKRCAYRGTEQYSNRPAASIVVTELVAQQGLDKPEGRRLLDEAGTRVVEAVAERLAQQVDELLGKPWNRSQGSFIRTGGNAAPSGPVVSLGLDGAMKPVQTLAIDSRGTALATLPQIFEKFCEGQKAPSAAVFAEMMAEVKVQCAVNAEDEASILAQIDREYRAIWEKREASRG